MSTDHSPSISAVSWSRARVAAGAAGLALFLAISVLSPAAQSATVEDLLPDEGALVGLYVKPKDGDWTQNGIKRRWGQIEDHAGRTLDAGHYYYNMNESFPTWREEWHADQGRIPVVSWASVKTTSVTNGTYDSQINARAQSVKAFGDPILIRWFWEMDGNKHAAESGTPAQYIAAWRHIVGIFRDQGVTNAQFVWCPNADAFKQGDAAQWYPGDAWVDWLCADGYNWAPGKNGSKWRSLSEVFQAFHDWGESKGKPMMIGETGVQERNSGEKGDWYRGMVTDLKNKMPAINLVIMYDSDTAYPWWMDTSQSSINGFRDMAQDPYMNGEGGGGGGTTTTRPPGTTTTTTAPPVAPPPDPDPPADGIEFRAASTMVGNQASYSVGVPNAVQKDDLMLLFVSTNNAVKIEVPKGWKVLGTKTDGEIRTRTMYRIARKADAGGAVDVNLGSIQKASITVSAYDGVNPDKPFRERRLAKEKGTAAAHRSPAVTNVRARSVIVRYWADRSSSTTDWSAPNGQRRRAEVIGSGGGRVTSLLTDSGGNSTDALSAVADSAADKATMWTIVLRAAR